MGKEMKHKHHDLIVQWAADTSKKVWEKGADPGYLTGWKKLSGTPEWKEHRHYHIGEQPPANAPTHEVVGNKQADLPTDKIRGALIARGWTPPTGDKP